jgi:hypothetical protein
VLHSPLSKKCACGVPALPAPTASPHRQPLARLPPPPVGEDLLILGCRLRVADTAAHPPVGEDLLTLGCRLRVADTAATSPSGGGFADPRLSFAGCRYGCHLPQWGRICLN